MSKTFKLHNRHETSDHHGPPRQPAIEVEIEILRGRAKRRMRPVRTPVFLIGTAEDCDMVLGDPQFAEVHAYLRIDEEGVFLRQLGFRPEVTLNGRTVGHARLADADRIRTGPFELMVHISRCMPGDDFVDDRLPAAVPPVIDRIEDEDAILRTRALLRDVHSAIASAEMPLRVYPHASGDHSERRTPFHHSSVLRCRDGF